MPMKATSAAAAAPVVVLDASTLPRIGTSTTVCTPCLVYAPGWGTPA